MTRTIITRSDVEMPSSNLAVQGEATYCFLQIERKMSFWHIFISVKCSSQHFTMQVGFYCFTNSLPYAILTMHQSASYFHTKNGKNITHWVNVPSFLA